MTRTAGWGCPMLFYQWECGGHTGIYWVSRSFLADVGRHGRADGTARPSVSGRDRETLQNVQEIGQREQISERRIEEAEAVENAEHDVSRVSDVAIVSRTQIMKDPSSRTTMNGVVTCH